MTKEQLAATLNGREYTEEITYQEAIAAKDAGLVVVFGASDDLMEFRGAIYDEQGACDGATALVDPKGLLPEREQIEDDGKLDVDGVLITAETCRQGFGKVDPQCVAAVNSLVEQTGAAIVLSSCWRIGRTRIECCDLLNEWGVKGVVLDKTPHFSYSSSRGKEIQAWLDSNQRHPVDSFVILDDDSDMDHLMPYLIKSTFIEGFTQAHIQRAIELLATQPTEGKQV